jgi:flagellar protein FliS
MVKYTQKYFEKEVLEGSPVEHIILLYGKAINCLKQVKRSITEGLNTPELVKTKAENLSRVVDILIYLEAILDLEKGGEIAKNLKEIYDIIIDELIKVNFTNELKPLDDSIEILENLKKAWIDIKPTIIPNPKETPAQLLRATP